MADQTDWTHLIEVTSDGDLCTSLAILWTPEALHDPKTSKVGVGLVYKAPHIWSTSFSEAYFSLKSHLRDRGRQEVI